MKNVFRSGILIWSDGDSRRGGKCWKIRDNKLVGKTRFNATFRLVIHQSLSSDNN